MNVVNTTLSLRISPFPPNIRTIPGAIVHRSFSGTDFRLPVATVTLFQSGKGKVVGFKDPERLNDLEDQIRDYFASKGFPLATVELTLSNIVANGVVTGRVDLPRLSQIFSARKFRVEYVPESYPALVLRPGAKPEKGKGMVFMLFPNGHLTLNGMKSLEECENELLGMMLEIELISDEA